MTDTEKEIRKRIVEDRNMSLLEAAATYSNPRYRELISPSFYKILQELNYGADLAFEYLDGE